MNISGRKFESETLGRGTDRGGRNTSLYYIYRDSSGVDSYGKIVVRGRLERKDLDMLLPSGRFIPEVLGIPPLRDDLGNDENASPWHEMVDAQPTHEEATLECDIDACELRGRLGSLEGEGWRNAERAWRKTHDVASSGAGEGIKIMKDSDGSMFAMSL